MGHKACWTGSPHSREYKHTRIFASSGSGPIVYTGHSLHMSMSHGLYMSTITRPVSGAYGIQTYALHVTRPVSDTRYGLYLTPDTACIWRLRYTNTACIWHHTQPVSGAYGVQSQCSLGVPCEVTPECFINTTKCLSQDWDRISTLGT